MIANGFISGATCYHHFLNVYSVMARINGDPPSTTAEMGCNQNIEKYQYAS